MIICGYSPITASFPGKIIDENVPEGEKYIRGSPKKREVLLAAGIKNERIMIIAVKDDDDAVYITLLAKHLNPDIKIAAVVKSAETVDKIKRAGADYVILESEILSREVLRHLLVPKVARFMERIILSDDLQIIGIKAPKEYINRKIRDTDIRKKIGTIIAIKRGTELIKNPVPDEVIRENDTLIFIVGKKEINKIRDVMGQWISRRE